MSKYRQKESLYLAVSQDKYELPIAVAGSEEELCRILKLKPGAVNMHISRAQNGKLKKQKYFRVEVNDD